MTLVSPSQSQPGTEIKAANINDPVNQITAVVNGGLDDQNISSISGAKLAAGSISAAKLDFSTGIWWQELGRQTLTVAGDTISVPSLPAKKALRIIAIFFATGGTVGLNSTVNNDSGSSYSRRLSTNGGADTTLAPGSVWLSLTAGTAPFLLTADIVNVSSQEKLISYNVSSANAAGSSAAPNRYEGTSKWINTSSQITRIDFTNTGTGDFAIGSEVIVLGHD